MVDAKTTSQYKIIFNKIVIQNGDQKGIADNSNNNNCKQSNNNNNGQSNDNNNHYLAQNAEQNAEVIIISPWPRIQIKHNCIHGLNT